MKEECTCNTGAMLAEKQRLSQTPPAPRWFPLRSHQSARPMATPADREAGKASASLDVCPPEELHPYEDGVVWEITDTIPWFRRLVWKRGRAIGLYLGEGWC